MMKTMIVESEIKCKLWKLDHLSKDKRWRVVTILERAK